MSPTPLTERRVVACAFAVFGLALVASFHEVWRSGPTRFAASLPREGASLITTQSDQRFVAWGAGRNAWTLLHRPGSLFDAEPCFPGERTLAFGEPMLALGILGLPARLFTSDAVATLNTAVAAGALLAAVAMYLLVADWTGVRAAGIVAGLLYAFGAVTRQHVTHPFVGDTSWTVLALFFGRRLFATGRWRDAAGAGVATSMQLATSFYPALAAFFLALPLAGWLLWRERLRRLRPGPVLLALALPVAAAALVYAPYLALREVQQLEREATIFYLTWGMLLPGGREFPGWPALALGVAAFAGGRRRACSPRVGDPRLALLLAGGLVAWAAMGPHARFPPRTEHFWLPLPDLYAAASAVLPGLDAVRVPMRVAAGVHLVASVLAGFGAAALIRSVPARVSPYVAGALVVVAYLDALRPGVLGLPPREPIVALEIAPDDATLVFFERLRQIDDGPLLEVPPSPDDYRRHSLSVLLTAYHHRRTSDCYNSFRPAVLREVERESRGLPGAAELQSARERGFTTIVLHHPEGSPSGPLRRRFRRAAETGAGLRLLLDDPHRTAYALTPPSGAVLEKSTFSTGALRE